MQFLKQHYEKILLGLVLIGLGVMAVALVFMVANEKEAQAARSQGATVYTVKPLDPPKLDDASGALKQADTPVQVEFSDNTNKLFNPERWQKKSDGTIFPNPPAAELKDLDVLNIRPLYLTISLVTSNVTDSGVRYGFGISDAGARRGPVNRPPVYIGVGESKDIIKLTGIKGATNDPTELYLELSDTGEKVTISKDKPYRRVSDHVADLRYAPENLTFRNCRANDPMHDKIPINGTVYNIVYITDDQVVLSAPSHKKTTKYFTPH